MCMISSIQQRGCCITLGLENNFCQEYDIYQWINPHGLVSLSYKKISRKTTHQSTRSPVYSSTTWKTFVKFSVLAPREPISKINSLLTQALYERQRIAKKSFKGLDKTFWVDQLTRNQSIFIANDFAGNLVPMTCEYFSFSLAFRYVVWFYYLKK